MDDTSVPDASSVPGLAEIFSIKSGRGSLSTRMAWSPDGRALAIPHLHGYVAIIDCERHQKSTVRLASTPEYDGQWPPADAAWCASWSRDGLSIAIGGRGTVRFLDPVTQCWVAQVECPATIYELEFSPDGSRLAAASTDGSVLVWGYPGLTPIHRLIDHAGTVRCVSWSPMGDVITSGGKDGTIRFWDASSGTCIRVLDGHKNFVNHIAWSRDGSLLATGSRDKTVGLWDPISGRHLRTLEGHDGSVSHVAFSPDGRILVSTGQNGPIKFWRSPSGTPLAITLNVRDDRSKSNRGLSTVFHPSLPHLATSGPNALLRVWNCDVDVFERLTRSDAVHYTSARVILVGDSGVGKTGLGWRISHGAFKEHQSTHGQQFWLVDQLRIRRSDGTDCEVVLWDLAGQPDYRIVHALFLADADLALILFDPTERQEPLKNVDYWLKALETRGDGRRPPAILVGARSDRGSLTLSTEEVAEFCRTRRVSGGFIETSALTGEGLPELMRRISSLLPWDSMTSTVTTSTFKRIKDYVLSLKESSTDDVLVRLTHLRSNLLAYDSTWLFDLNEIRVAVSHLSTHGYVATVRNAVGEDFVLLKPEILGNLAASVVLEARRQPKGLGVLDEERLLQRGYQLPELGPLQPEQADILVDAVTSLFVSRNLCFRETLGRTTLLVFPALINQAAPMDGQVALEDDVTFLIVGAVENVYASLVVLLGYTNAFTRTNHWRSHALYEFESGEVCGFRQVQEREGEISLVLRYAPGVHASTRLLFEGLFQKFLLARDVSVVRFPAVSCPGCGHRQERVTVVRRVQQGRGFLHCDECGERVILPATTEDLGLRAPERLRVRSDEETARRRTGYESALVRLKGLLRDRGIREPPPNCFVSYAWGDVAFERWVVRLAMDLRNAGIEVLLDRWHNAAIGSDVARFVGRIASVDFVVVVGSPRYLQKSENRHSDEGSIAAAELDVINQRLSGSEAKKETVLPVLRAGTPDESLPVLMRGRVRADFRKDLDYFTTLLDMVLTVHRFHFDDPAVVAVRALLETELP